MGARGHGEKLTELQAAVTIAAFLLYRSDGTLVAPSLAHSAAAKARVAALLTGRSAKAAEAQWVKFKAQGRLVLEVPGARGPKRAHEAELLALEATVKEHVRRVLLQQGVPGWVTRRSLQTLLREATGVHAGLPAISRLCKAWGLAYGRLRRPPAAATPKRLLQRDVAVCQLRRALAEGHTVLSADESFCNERESREFSLHPVGAPFAAFARASGSGLGRRLCFIQALGLRGLAGVPADLRAVVGSIAAPEPHCEMMFAAQQGVGDYHGNFTHPVFMQWVRQRLIPWALCAHPELAPGPPGALQRKLCLMLDNAPYHTGTPAPTSASTPCRPPRGCSLRAWRWLAAQRWW